MGSKNRIGMHWHQGKTGLENLTHILGHSVFTLALNVEVGNNPDGMNNVVADQTDKGAVGVITTDM